MGAPTGQPVQVLLPWVRTELLECVSDDRAPVLNELRAEAADDAPAGSAAAAKGGAKGGSTASSKPVLPTLLIIARELLDDSVTADTNLLEARLTLILTLTLTQP